MGPDQILAPTQFVEQFVRPRRPDEPDSAPLRQPEELGEDDLRKEQAPPPFLGVPDDGPSAGRKSPLEEADQGDGVEDGVRQGLVSLRSCRIERSRSAASIRPLRSPYRLWRGRGRMRIPASVSTTRASSPTPR